VILGWLTRSLLRAIMRVTTFASITVAPRPHRSTTGEMKASGNTNQTAYKILNRHQHFLIAKSEISLAAENVSGQD
jgi:hypothetical protein